MTHDDRNEDDAFVYEVWQGKDFRANLCPEAEKWYWYVQPDRFSTPPEFEGDPVGPFETREEAADDIMIWRAEGGAT